MKIREPIIKKFHPHPFNFIGFYFSGIILIVVSFFVHALLLPVGLLSFALAELVRRAETFYILESGVSREYKLLTTSRKFAEYDKIQNLEVTQSFIENLLGIGTVHMDTAGMDKMEVSFHGVEDPYRIENIIRERMRLT